MSLVELQQVPHLTLFLGLEQIIQQNIEIETTEKLELNIYNQTLCLGED